jgi:nucleotide-binding universal stress UspA family protein
MPVKTILLPLSEADAAEPVLETALILAQRFEAHLEVLYARRNPGDNLPYGTLGMSRQMRDAVLEASRQNAASQADQIHELFNTICARAGVAVVDTRTGCENASATWREATGHEDTLVAVRGRLSDLIVLPGPIPVSPPPAVAEAALKATGRPVLITPPRAEKVVASNVGIGWNGSAEAARAVTAAMAYLHAAESVTVFTGTGHRPIDPPAADLVDYLGWHGVDASVRTFAAHDPSIGQSLLNEARANGINLLVVGGYTRSRVREMIFGSVTGHLLASSEIPVLMVH